MPGKHPFTVCATDGKGMLQIGDEQPVWPDGAAGYHSVHLRLSPVRTE